MGKKFRNTEQVILNAAKDVFIQKGFYGARMQEIADIADINKAMLHYYFKNKEELYERVYTELFNENLINAKSIFEVKGSFKDKLKLYINKLLESMADKPEVICFLISEYNRHPERCRKFINNAFVSNTSDLIAYFEAEAQNEVIKRIDFREFVLHLNSLCTYPVMTKEIYTSLFGFKTDKEYSEFLKKRNKFIFDQLLNTLGIN